MITKGNIELVLDKFGMKNYDIIYSRYCEPHRYYHNFDHIMKLLNRAEKRGILTDSLLLAIVFHDIVYDPRRKDNEEQSAKLFYSLIKRDDVAQAIRETENHVPSTLLSRQLCDLDMEDLYGDFFTFVNNSKLIEKEYQFLDWSVFQENRIEFLKKHQVNPIYIDHIKVQTRNIAVYPGSFNPFHVGHMNILEKAEKIFDKVIIARGVNPEKSASQIDLPSALKYRQIEYYDGLLSDFIKKFPYKVTVIRGLRNTTDLQYELTQYRYLQDLDPNIKIVSIFCDKEFEHVSSSSIRMLRGYGKGSNYLI